MLPVCLSAIAAMVAAGPGAAAILRIWPVLVDLAGTQRAGALTLANPDAHPTAVQLRAFRWTQDAQGDHLQPTRDLVVSPPAMRLDAGASHVIRVIRLSSAPAKAEESYRVLVDEIPEAAERTENGINFVLRQSIPVFYNATKAGKPDVTWRLARGDKGWILVARNIGTRRIQVSDLKLKDAKGAVLEHKPGLLGYVLSGAEMAWPLKTDTPASRAASLTAVTETGPLNADLGAPPPL